MVELRPPSDSGFSGTVTFTAQADAPLIQELLRRGYTVVDKVAAVGESQ